MTNDLLDRPDGFETRLRAGLDHLAGADPIADPGPFDPDVRGVVTVGSDDRRRPVFAFAAAATVVAAAGGVALLATRDTAPVGSTPSPVTATAPSPTDPGFSPLVEALLRDVPLPDGFGAGSIDERPTGDTGPNPRYTLIAQASGAVACAWLDQWFTGQETDDAAAQEEAAAALATATTWPMLLEINSQGAWSEVVWQWADAVNGGAGVMTGLGPQPPTRERAREVLGCDF